MAESLRFVRFVTLCTCLLVLVAGAGAASFDTDATLQQFLTRTEPPIQSYEAHRLMRARNGRFKKEAWLEALTRLDPQNGFTYEVTSSGGSSYIINRVLIPALKGEAEMLRNRDPERNGLTEENYAFAPASPLDGEAPEEVSIALKPRRKHILLVDGLLYLSPRDGDLLRVEGRLSKSPSFWVSRVEVVRRYARIKGVRVPVEFESTAHVRIAGRSEMQIVYLYQSINQEPVAPPDAQPLPN
jgi:hypothetical protein